MILICSTCCTIKQPIQIRHCSIQDVDLVKMNLFYERELHLPAYILTVDHATKSVVLSVRGTFSMQDTVTDLVCDSAGER